MTSDIINLVILGIVIVLLFVVQQNYQNNKPSENFVGKVPQTPIGNGMHYMYNVPGGHPTGQPMMYPEQLYQAKIPYYDDSIHNIGRPCTGPNGCGVFGTCANGTCTVKDKSNTVFNLKI
jgi:hypothetical protein